MKKVLIIGDVASGKTTLAKRLSNIVNFPWYELDSIVYHKSEEGRYTRTAVEQIQVIMDIDKNGTWIFEGTDRESYRCLFELADTIIFLDTPFRKRKRRILTRFFKQYLGIEKCHYRPDITMLKMMYKWARDFEKNRADFEARLFLYRDKVIKLYNNEDMEFIKKFND